MIVHLRDRASTLTAHGWTRCDAEWLALVCLFGGVFLRSQYLAFIGRTNPALANRFIRRCRKVAVEQPWNGSRLRLCRITARPIHQAAGAEHFRHWLTPAPEIVLRRLLALDFVLSHPFARWLPTEDDKVNALIGAGIPKHVLPSRLYKGAVGSQYRYFPHKLPLAFDEAGAMSVFVQAEDTTESALRTSGAQHAKLWAALAAAGRTVEVVIVGRDVMRLAAAGRVLDRWAATHLPAEVEPAAAAAELESIRRAIATANMTALDAYGGLNPAMRRMGALTTAATGGPSITRGRIWRSQRVPA